MVIESWWIHCGLGDLAVLSAAIAQRSKTRRVLIPVYEHNLVSAKSFFIDFPNVVCYPIPLVEGECWGVPNAQHLSVDGTIVRTGHYVEVIRRNDICFAEWFYEQLWIS